MPEEFSLGLAEVDVAVRRAGLPANWHPFEIPSAGATIDEHEQIAAEAWESLRARRLAERDKLDADVEHTLRTWTLPDVLIIVRAVEIADNRKVFYRATIADGLGVYSELVPDGIKFVRIRPDHLVDDLVTILPRYGPLPVSPASIVPASPDRDALAPFAAWAPHRHGTFELSTRHGHGKLHPVGTVSFTDTEGGRYLTFTEPLPGGDARQHFVPSDGSHLRRWLHETIAETRD
ncbi:MAG TPA: ESX secretion-associated protein EspG [Amycolatopsis sp.]|nr:ESX secretion-associated protein EspG [Amycolatopsis sp.]